MPPRPKTPSKQLFRLSSTDREILEKTANDFSLFSQWFFDIDPIPWQTWFYHKPQKRKILIAGIRSGKTYTISLGFPHYALFNPYCRIANASISADQAKIVFFNVLDLVSRPNFERYVKDSRKHPFPVIELVNGAEMWFRSVGYEAELWRGWEFDWVNVDEAAYIGSKNTYDTLAGRLLGRNTHLNRPRDGRLSITTSPKGRGWLYDEYKKGDPAFPDVYNPDRYLSLRVRSTDNPYLDREELQALMNEYSDRQRQQELEGAFLDPEDAVFSWEAIQYMCDGSRDEVRGLIKAIDDLAETPDQSGFVPKVLDKSDYHRYELSPGRNRTYLVSWDLGTTATRHLGRNATVGMVFDISERPWKLVAFRRERKATYSLIIQWVKEWHLRYNSFGQNAVETVIDASGSGNPVQQILQDEHGLDVEGLVYNQTNKPDIINAGQVCIERGLVITPPIRALMDELSGYEIDDKKIVQDCVMAFCQGLHRARMRDGDLSRSRSGLILPTRTSPTRRSAEMAAGERYESRRMASRRERTGRDSPWMR